MHCNSILQLLIAKHQNRKSGNTKQGTVLFKHLSYAYLALYEPLYDSNRRKKEEEM